MLAGISFVFDAILKFKIYVFCTQTPPVLNFAKLILKHSSRAVEILEPEFVVLINYTTRCAKKKVDILRTIIIITIIRTVRNESTNQGKQRQAAR